MFEVLFNGAEYIVAPVGSHHPGWSLIDPARTLEEGMPKVRRTGSIIGVFVVSSQAGRSESLLHSVRE
jgi:hypothetical protein